MLTRPAVSLLLLCLAFAAAAAAPQRAARCEFEGVKFACPEGFKPEPRAAGERFLLFQQKKSKLGAFIAVHGEGEDMTAFARELLTGVPQKFLPREKQEFKWAEALVPEKVSKFEAGVGAAQGFNGSVLVLLKFRHVKFGGKGFIVGYVSELKRGGEAASMFARGAGVEDMAGCGVVAEIVLSITGEELEEPPCQLSVIAPPNQ